MKVDFNGVRKNLTRDLNHLGWALDQFLKGEGGLREHEIREAFDNVAQDVNIINCFCDDDDPSFNDIGNEVRVDRIGDDSEE